MNKKFIVILLIFIIASGVVSSIFFLPKNNITHTNSTATYTSKITTVHDFEKLKKGDSYYEIVKQFGKPEKDIGSGLHIFVYTLSDGSEVLLGFADLNSLIYVKHRQKDSTMKDIVGNP